MDPYSVYKKLCRASYHILDKHIPEPGNSAQVRSDFMDGFFGVIESAYKVSAALHGKFDINLYHNKKLEEIGELVENPRTYMMLNYYMIMFIDSVRVNLEKEDAEVLDMKLEEMGIDKELAIEVEREYEKVMGKKG